MFPPPPVQQAHTLSVRCGQDLLFPPRPFGGPSPIATAASLAYSRAPHSSSRAPPTSPWPPPLVSSPEVPPSTPAGMTTTATARVLYIGTERALYTGQHEHTIGGFVCKKHRSQSGWPKEDSICLPLWETGESEGRRFKYRSCGF